MQDITFRSLLASYRRDKMAEELAGEWGVALLYRPIALALVAPLARTRVSPLAVTLSGLALLPLMPGIALLVQPDSAFAWVCGLSVLYCIVDCADGSLARLQRRETLSGWYIDLSGDLLYRVTVYASLGYLTNVLTGSHGSWIALALLAAWLALFARVARLYGELLVTRGMGSSTNGAETSTRSIIKNIHMALSGLDGLFPLLALAAWWYGQFTVFWWWILVYSAADALYSHLLTWSRVRSC